MMTKTITVPNISCGHCTNTIERELKELTGIVSVKAEKSTRQVTIEWQELVVTWVAISDLLKEIGYPAVE
jgi:copper chaperone CopZ